MGGVIWGNANLITRVVGPAESTEKRSRCGNLKLFGVGIEVGEGQAKALQQQVGVFDFQVVIFLVAEDDEAAAPLNKADECFDVGSGEMGGCWMRAHGFVTGIGDEEQTDAGQRLFVDGIVVRADFEIGGEMAKNFAISASGEIARFTGGIVVPAVEKRRFAGVGRSRACNECEQKRGDCEGDRDAD